MKTFYDEENICSLTFASLGRCYHLWTPEDFEIIFTCNEEFKAGMNILAISAKLFPDVKIITFEWMSNHLHVTAAGEEAGILEMFNLLVHLLKRFFNQRGRIINWSKFKESYREILSLEELRNVIVYNNRNGAVVYQEFHTFTYPWGANSWYFNPVLTRLAFQSSKPMTLRDRRCFSSGHRADKLDNILVFDGCALPPSFCDIEMGEKLFRNPSSYFYKVSRSIESMKFVADEIKESVFYSDDELFGIICSIARGKYHVHSPSLLDSEGKLQMAKLMKYEYNASLKQIKRMLKLSDGVVSTLFPHK